MILEIYITLFVVSVAFVFLGYFTDIEVLKFVGFVFIFLLGTVPLLSSIDYKSGDTIIQNGTTTTVTANYTAYSDNTFGFFISVVGVMGWVMLWIQHKSYKKIGEES